MSDFFLRAFGSAMTDIRQQLVERGWVGEVVTPRPFASHDQVGTQQSVAERMGWDPPGDREQPEPNEPEQERGIDR